MLCHEYPPIGGGAAAVCAALGSHYARGGHAVTVLTMGFADLPSREARDGCRVLRVPCGRRRKEMASAWEALRWAWRCGAAIGRLHRVRPFDVCHAHFIMPAGIVADGLKRRCGVPFVVTPHGSDVPGYNRERLKLAHMLVRPWWRSICRRADRIISPSASLLGMIGRYAAGHRGEVVPNGFDPGRFRPAEKQRRILLCSRLVERKGFHVFLEAVRGLDLPGWGVDIVGDGPMMGRVRALAARCRMPVEVHGWIDNDDPRLADLYGRAMIFALPSEWENLSIALLEGMSAGCAVIATDVSGNPEALGDTGWLVPPGDSAAVRRAVQALAADPERCRELGERAARRAAERFDWSVIARRYLARMESLARTEETQPCASA